MAWWFAPSPASAIHAGPWMGFAYVSLFSMWIGFFAWYRALALGAVRVSQAAVGATFFEPAVCRAPVGERLDGTTLAFALAVIATVYAGKSMPIHTAGKPA